MKSVCWLEVHGKFDTRKLSLGILYQVSFIVMLKDSAQGWEVPINVRLVLPGGKKQQHKENLNEKLRECWIEIPVGELGTRKMFVTANMAFLPITTGRTKETPRGVERRALIAGKTATPLISAIGSMASP